MFGVIYSCLFLNFHFIANLSKPEGHVTPTPVVSDLLPSGSPHLFIQK